MVTESVASSLRVKLSVKVAAPATETATAKVAGPFANDSYRTVGARSSSDRKWCRSSGRSLDGGQVTKGITQSHSTIESRCTSDGQFVRSRRC